MMFLPTARKLAQCFCIFCVVICWVGGGVITFLVFVFFDLRWTRLLSFGGHTSCYVGHVFCTSVMLDTSSVLWWMYFILRWTRLLSASWPEEKRSAGALAKRILQHTFLVPTAIKQRFSVDPSRSAVPKRTKMIVDMRQTPGFEQKETKTDLKK